MDDVEDIEQLERAVYHYRMAGDSVAEIGEKMHLALPMVAKLHRAYAKRLAMLVAEGDNAAKAMEMDRLDALQRSHWLYATQPFAQEVVVGSGPSAHIETVTMPPDPKAAKVVLDVIKQRSRLMGWDAVDIVDQTTTNNILVVGTNQRAFLEALEEGRRPALASGHPDNVIEGVIKEAG